jgi:DNA replication protein DnaC
MRSALKIAQKLQSTMTSQVWTTNQERLTQARLNGLTKTKLVCKEHGETDFSINELSYRCIACHDEKEKADKARKKFIEESKFSDKLKYNLARAGIPKRFLKKMLWNYKPDSDGSKKALRVCNKYSENFDDRFENGGGLVMCGCPGTGKTHLAIGIGLEAIADGYTMEYDSAINIIRAVRESYKKGAEHTETEVINHFVNVDLLIVDEVGVQYGTDSEKIILFDVINGRYNQVKPTIIISNLSLIDLGGFVGDRVIDRMKEGGGAVLSFDWSSYRK